MKYLFYIISLLLLTSCSNKYKLANNTEYLQGKIIYEIINKQDTFRKMRDISDKTDQLDICQQYLLAVYILSEGLEDKESPVMGYSITFVENLVGNLKFHTSIFRGEHVHYMGIVYRSRVDAKKDLKDWKKKLNCK